MAELEKDLFSFCYDTLSGIEAKRMTESWLANLKTLDVENVREVLKAAYEGYINAEEWCVMNAVGSTIRRSYYKDVDLLLLGRGDYIVGDVYLGRLKRDLPSHICNLVEPGPYGEFPSWIRYFENVINLPDRKLLEIERKEDDEDAPKKVHLILQPNVKSIKTWDKIDRKRGLKRIPIYRVNI